METTRKSRQIEDLTYYARPLAGFSVTDNDWGGSDFTQVAKKRTVRLTVEDGSVNLIVLHNHSMQWKVSFDHAPTQVIEAALNAALEGAA